MLLKRCTSCEKEKEPHDFFKDRRGSDGVESICKRCRLDTNNRNRAKNRAKYNEYQRKWQSRPEWKKYLSEWHAKNKERRLALAKSDPDYLAKKNVRWHRRKARLVGNGGNHTVAEWNGLKEKHGNECVACGEIKLLTKDHIIPISQGGTNDISNIQPLCQSCNSKKGHL